MPLYVNVAVRDPFHAVPGSYESGGATDNMIDLWKAAAPAIDVLGPDLYTPDYAVYTKLLDIYHRPDNPMFIPETGNASVYARYLFAALGHQAIGYSAFGMDKTGFVNAPLGASQINDETLDPFALVYGLIGPMDAVIARLNFEGKLKGVSEDASASGQSLVFGKWTANISYGLGQFGNDKLTRSAQPNGGAMVAQLGPEEVLVTGVHVRVDFALTDKTSPDQRQYVRVQEGTYDRNAWQPTRLWNGDQTDWGLNFTSIPQVLHVRLATY